MHAKLFQTIGRDMGTPLVMQHLEDELKVNFVCRNNVNHASIHEHYPAMQVMIHAMKSLYHKTIQQKCKYIALSTPITQLTAVTDIFITSASGRHFLGQVFYSPQTSPPLKPHTAACNGDMHSCLSLFPACGKSAIIDTQYVCT